MSDPALSTTATVPTTWSRLVLVWVQPSIDGGRYPIARSADESVDVVAGIIVDGHEKLAVELLYRHESEEEQSIRMPLRWNDEYYGSFKVPRLGRYEYRVRAWLDRFATWQDQFKRRVDGGEHEYELKSELLDGAALLRDAARTATKDAADRLDGYALQFEAGNVNAGLDPAVERLMQENDPRHGAIESTVYSVRVDPVLGRFCAWYEFFPRSAAGEPGVHGTLDDAAALLPRIREQGFDIVYLPPIHPIGISHRKGKDNAPTAGPNDPGSPWAIGGHLQDGTLGGHKSVLPELGGIEAFDRFVSRADEQGLKVALDIAFQTSPDHPYVKEHPEWFKHRPDGTIRYAENPPKKYQDVYPFDFESGAWPSLWNELKSVFEYWIEHGVRIFRVDNPHTKPFAFWEWCLGDLRSKHPDLIFLAEAFSRPKIMHTLAKIGFNQSYTYFTWRNTRQEIEEYARELFHTEVAEYFRPCFWPNTPDILHEYLVHGGRPAHVVRLVLAATMSSAYGLYGPPYEHVVNNQHPLREEYADNEKYEIRTWNWNDPHSLQPVIQRINTIRRENPALHYMRNIQVHETDNSQLVAYSKRTGDNVILVVVNLDPRYEHSGWLTLDLGQLGVDEHRSYDVHDLLGGGRYTWQGSRNFVKLNPFVLPAHVFRIQQDGMNRQDFPTFW